MPDEKRPREEEERRPVDSDRWPGFRRIETLGVPTKRISCRWRRDREELDETLDALMYGLLSGFNRWPLYLWGDTGVGKSCAGLLFMDAVLDGAWFDLDRICQALVNHEAHWWERASEAELVVLDEIGGRDQVTSVDYDAVKKFADLRERNANRVAVYISNLGPSALVDHYGDRVASRLLCGTVFHLQGSDRRRK